MKSIYKLLIVGALASSLTACAGFGGIPPNSTDPKNDLVLPKQAVKFSMGSSINNVIFEPATTTMVEKTIKVKDKDFGANEEGILYVKDVVREKEIMVEIPNGKVWTGPRPAVVLMHACAGITLGNSYQLKGWTKTFTDNGYYVLVIDHLKQRTFERNCYPRIIGYERLVKDLHDAVDHLSKMPNIDKNRIFTMGFSLGGMTGGLAASEYYYNSWAKGRLRPRAIGSAYGGCQYRNMNFLPQDANIPVLWLMGDKDLETPYEDCMASLESIKKRIPETRWEIYKDTVHCWDCKDANGFTRTANNGARVTYLYNEESTKKAHQAAIEFFGQFK